MKKYEKGERKKQKKERTNFLWVYFVIIASAPIAQWTAFCSIFSITSSRRKAMCNGTFLTLEIILSYLWDRVCSIFSGAGKFCLAHGPGQLTRDVKDDVRTHNFRSGITFAPSRKTPNDVRKGRNAT